MKIYNIMDVLNKIKGCGKIIKNSSLAFQKAHWEEALSAYDWKAERLYGYDWGDPENPDDKLGNYLRIKTKLLSMVNSQTTFMEIGSLGGKWIQYVRHAKKIICVDINSLGFEYIKRKIGRDNMEFYLTRGDELRGIPDNSVDVIFSMDSLIRVRKKYLIRYFKEMSRVLKPGGKIFCHFPCVGITVSRFIWFNSVTIKGIERLCEKNNFKDVALDTKVITHGVMVEATRAEK